MPIIRLQECIHTHTHEYLKTMVTTNKKKLHDQN